MSPALLAVFLTFGSYSVEYNESVLEKKHVEQFVVFDQYPLSLAQVVVPEHFGFKLFLHLKDLVFYVVGIALGGRERR